MHTLEVLKVLQATPEIFLKVPGDSSTGANLYALRPSIVAQGNDKVITYVNRLARRDRILYHAFVIAMLAVIVVLALRSVAFFRYFFGT